MSRADQLECQLEVARQAAACLERQMRAEREVERCEKEGYILYQQQQAVLQEWRGIRQVAGLPAQGGVGARP
eukprot:155094-Heterocapsa_arctica.AAC.1